MCGIWLYLQKEKNYDEKQLQISFDKIKNRGPDKSTFKTIINNRLYLGFHRLSIIDLSENGNQPFVTKTNNNIIYTMCNGEIYNYEKLINKYKLNPQSHSDCAVIPELFNKIGLKLTCEELLGEYAFCILVHNTINNNITIHLARDSFGIRPLFYFFNSNSFGICSEIKGLKDISKNENIRPFPPGCFMTYNEGIIKLESYFNLSKSCSFDKALLNNHNDVLKNINYLLTKSVNERLQTDREIGALLSGGIDSSLVAAIAARQLEKTGKRLKTFSIGTQDSTDLKYANMVAKHINSIHHVIDFNPEEAIKIIPQVIKATETYDITTIRASTVQFLLMQKVKNFVPCVLNGDGSDEVSGSYLYFHNFPNEKDFHEECLRLLEEIFYYDVLRVDRTIASNGVEARVPFLDPEYVKYYLSIHPSLRVPRKSELLKITDCKIEKALLREAFIDDNLIPMEVLCRKKEAFSDGCSNTDKSWFKIIQNYIDTQITDDEFLIAKTTYTNNNFHNQPQTKEALYYRRIFKDTFGEHNTKVIPHMWLPKWCGDIQEPSARVLSVYK